MYGNVADHGWQTLCYSAGLAGLMKQEMDLVKTFIGVQCSFVMTAHLSLEKDEVSGRLIQVPMALGQKNGPALVPLFGDIVLCRRTDKQFTWSTTSAKTIV